jgi:hypothetical protein
MLAFSRTTAQRRLALKRKSSEECLGGGDGRKRFGSQASFQGVHKTEHVAAALSYRSRRRLGHARPLCAIISTTASS